MLPLQHFCDKMQERRKQGFQIKGRERAGKAGPCRPQSMKTAEWTMDHPLFRGLLEGQRKSLLEQLRFTVRNFRKNEYILMEGDEVHNIGIVLLGEIALEKEDMFGEGCFLLKLEKGEILGDMFIGENVRKSSVNYRALTDCELWMFSYRNLWESAAVRPENQIFLENLAGLLAVKARRMLAKVEILSAVSLRQRILTCLRLYGEERAAQGGDASAEYSVVLPLNKTELAEFLCVNRSALMRELKKMKDENILSCEGDKYTIKRSFERL